MGESLSEPTSSQDELSDPSPVGVLPPERLEALVSSLVAISGILDLRLLLGTVLDEACSLLTASQGSIGLVDSERQVVRIWDARGLLRSAVDVDIPFGVGLAGEVARTGRTIHLARYDMLPHPMFQTFLDYAVLGIPILGRGGEVAAYLGVGCTPPRRFEEADVALLEAFGRQTTRVLQAVREVESTCRKAVEEDRKVIASYLHEGVKGRLALISGRAQMIDDAWERSPQEGRRQTAETLTAIREAIGHTKKLLRELQKPEIESAGVLPAFLEERYRDELRDGLPEALERLAKRPRKGLRVDFVSRHYVPQTIEVEKALLHIAREALTNVIRHAHAQTVTIMLSQEKNMVSLKVIDDGVGFDSALSRAGMRLRPRSGAGLAGMREVVERRQGEVRVSPCPTGGTMVHAVLPGREKIEE